MNILFIAGGYPSIDKPQRGIFNARAVKSLSVSNNITVCHFRYWKPKRKLMKFSKDEHANIITLSLPWIPINNSMINSLQFRLWAKLTCNLLNRIFKENKIDLIHSVNLEMALIGSALSKKFGVNHFSQATGSDIFFYMPKMEVFFKACWIKHTSAIICNSKNLEERVNLQYPHISAFTCYRGVDFEQFKFVPRMQKERKIFLFMGGFSNRKGSEFGADLKGGEFLKRVWVKLNINKVDRPILILCGPESANSNMQKWRMTLPHPEDVELLGDVNPIDVPNLMERADVLLLPSKSEGMPNVVLEAMASGLIVIASNVGGVPEIIAHNKNGYLLDPYDEDLWLQTMYQIIASDRDYLSMSSDARYTVQEKFNASTYGDRLMKIYMERGI